MPRAKLAYSIPELAKASSISRTMLKRYIKRGAIQTVEIGGRTIITAEEAKRFLSTPRPSPGRPRKSAEPAQQQEGEAA